MTNYKIKYMLNNKSIANKEMDFEFWDDAKEYFDKLNRIDIACDRIILLESKRNTVTATKEFNKRECTDTFYDKDVVKLKAEFCTEQEKNYIFRVTDINENTGRCLITCLNSGAHLPCSECVDITMITKPIHIG